MLSRLGGCLLRQASVIRLDDKLRTTTTTATATVFRNFAKLRKSSSLSSTSTELRTSMTVSEDRIKRLVGKWLLGCSGAVFGAVVLGGITRLTESGLSMVDWHLFKERPPLSRDEWTSEFEKYKRFPEFKYKHKDITLQEFKFIWYMEYGHRMWGRVIGALFVLPAAYFCYRGYFNRAMKIRVGGFGLLIGFQGLLGWYMVKSGLEEKQDSDYVPRVSQHRLAFHLGTAFLLYTLLLWSSLAHLCPPQQLVVTTQLRKFRMFAHGTKGLAFLTAISGAFVAGLGAGMTYNTFPKMADKWVPDDLLALEPTIVNFTENPTTVQFDHRILGTGTLIAVLGLWAYSRRLILSPRARQITNAILVVGLTQVGLGIATLLTCVPVSLAALHQAGALSLLTVAVWLTHELKLVKRVAK